MVEFIIGMGSGIFLSIAIAALILSLASRQEGDELRAPRRGPARDYDRESRIAAARLRNIREKDIPEAR